MFKVCANASLKPQTTMYDNIGDALDCVRISICESMLIYNVIKCNFGFFASGEETKWFLRQWRRNQMISHNLRLNHMVSSPLAKKPNGFFATGEETKWFLRHCRRNQMVPSPLAKKPNYVFGTCISLNVLMRYL